VPRERADLAWYSGESRKQKLSPRCPIAHAELCPRYFESVEALGRAGRITQIPSERVASLDRKWKAFQPVIAEEEPWLRSSGGELGERDRLSVHNFCPEVCYDVYGYFASDMFDYTDEIDRREDRTDYNREGIKEKFDSRWERVTPRHYTACREYSIHTTFAGDKPSKAARKRGEVSPKRKWHVLARDSFTCTYCGRKPPEVALHVDHKVSVKDGGSDDLDNLVTACDECNLGKSDSSV